MSVLSNVQKLTQRVKENKQKNTSETKEHDKIPVTDLNKTEMSFT